MQVQIIGAEERGTGARTGGSGATGTGRGTRRR